MAHQPLRCTDALTVGVALVGVQRADAAVDRDHLRDLSDSEEGFLRAFSS